MLRVKVKQRRVLLSILFTSFKKRLRLEQSAPRFHCAMVKSFVFLLLCVGIILLDFKKAEAHSKSLGRGDNGGLPCATCTILLSISSQMAQIYNETTVESLTRLCTFLPKTYQGECEALVEYLAPIIDKEIDEHFTVDVVCYSIGLCYVDPGRKMCNLFPLPPNLQLPAKSAVINFNQF